MHTIFSTSSPPLTSFLQTSPNFLGAPPSTTTPSPPSSPSVRSRPPRIAATYTSTGRAPPRSPTIGSTSSLYEVLGLSTAATCHEIKAAYRRLVRVCHPDVVATDRKDTSADEFMRIHAAYSTLSDPEKRADYDRTLLMQQRQQPRPFASASGFSRATSFSGHGRRSWETDQCW